MLEVRDIHKSFGGVHAIQGSSFVVEEGKVTALIGPNGAGKTTLFDIITGLLQPDSGSIFLNGDSITSVPPHERVRRGISRTFQQVRLFQYLTIADHFQMIEDHNDTKLLRMMLAKKESVGERYDTLLSQFGIDRSADTLVSELSYGQRKLVELVMAVESKHTLLMLDEPVAGVNKVLQEQIESYLVSLKEEGETMLIIDHDMAFIRRLADTVVVLDAGRVIVSGSPDDVLSDPRVLAAYLGE